MADKLGKLYVLIEKNEDGTMQFYRGNPDGKRWNSGKRRNIRVFPTLKLAEAAIKANEAPDNVVIEEFVVEDMELRDPYSWDWPELENIINAFDHVEVNFFDGGEHIPFGADSGVSVLRVVDVSPTKGANGKVTLHIATDNNWFGKGRNRIFSDDYIVRLIESNPDLMPSQRESLKKTFKIGVPPVGPPMISSDH